MNTQSSHKMVTNQVTKSLTAHEVLTGVHWCGNSTLKRLTKKIPWCCVVVVVVMTKCCHYSSFGQHNIANIKRRKLTFNYKYKNQHSKVVQSLAVSIVLNRIKEKAGLKHRPVAAFHCLPSYFFVTLQLTISPLDKSQMLIVSNCC